jgi:hypothetical protein
MSNELKYSTSSRKNFLNKLKIVQEIDPYLGEVLVKSKGNFTSQLKPLLQESYCKKIWKEHKLDDTNLIVVLGSETFYVRKLFYDWLKKNPLNRLIIVEWSREKLCTLIFEESSLDWFDHPQITIAFREENEKSHIRFVQSLQPLLSRDPKIVFFSQENLKEYQEIESLLKTLFIQENYSSKCDLELNYRFFHNFYHNISSFDQYQDCTGLFGKWKNIPAVIIGAGPSLEDSYSFLELSKDYALNIACGTSLNALSKKGIRPHLEVGLDTSLEVLERSRKQYLYEIPIAFRSRITPEVIKEHQGDLLYLKGRGWSFFEEEVEKRMGAYSQCLQDSTLSVDEGISVSCLAVELALKLGCNPIILVGIDLCYNEGQEYAGSIGENLLGTKKLIEDKSRKWIGSVKSSNNIGQSVMSRWRWIAEKDQLGKSFKNYPDISVINTTQKGLSIPYTHYMGIDEVKKEHFLRKRDIGNELHQLLKSLPYIDSSKELVSEELKKLLKSFQRTEEILYSLLEEFDKVLQSKELKTWKKKGKIILYKTLLEEEDVYNIFLWFLEKRFEESLERKRDSEEIFYEIESTRFLLHQSKLHINYILLVIDLELSSLQR